MPTFQLPGRRDRKYLTLSFHSGSCGPGFCQGHTVGNPSQIGRLFRCWGGTPQQKIKGEKEKRKEEEEEEKGKEKKENRREKRM